MRLAPSRSRHLARLFRVAVLLVLAAVTGQGTLAWISPCSAHGEAEAAREDTCCPHASRASKEADAAAAASGAIRQGQSDDDARCSCPVGCGGCCAGMPSSNVSTVAPAAPTAVLTFSLLTFVTTTRLTADGEPFDILHVPRA